MRTLRFLLCGLFLSGAVAHAQVPPSRALSTFTVHNPALELSLWASEPLFSNPTCIDIDHRGRIWVCESVNYRHTLFHRPPNRPAGDRILILEDSKGTGHADKVTTFYQSPELLAPLGIAVAKDPVGPGYKVFVCQSPNILVFEDKDGDGKADGPPRKLLTGFGGIDHDHGVHGILIGPDNKLYFSVGDQGVHGLRGKNGKRAWSSNNTDCQGGTIWRCDLDGSNLELMAFNFRNEYEPCVDSFGTIFVSDNDDDGNQQTRICYVMPGGNYGYWPRGPHESHWHEEQPGVVPKILRTYFGSPTGMQVYEGTLLPRQYWGQPLHTDAGPRQVRCYHLKPEGAGYHVDREDIVTSTDAWFRPSDVCVAPDGSVYIADWYDPGVGGHGMGDTRRGRIYRLAPKGNRPSVPKVDLNSRAGLTAALASPARSVRYMAMAKLAMMKREDALDVLIPAAEQKANVYLRARALWQVVRWIGPFSGKVSEVLASMADDPDPRFRTMGVRIQEEYLAPNWVTDTGGEHPEALFHFAEDPSPAVRRELLLYLRQFHAWAALRDELLPSLARKYDGHDRFYLEAIGIAVGHYDQARRKFLLANFARNFPQWTDKVADLVWELQPPDMLPVLEERLTDARLSHAQRARVADILAVYPDIDAGKSLLQALQKKLPDEVRDHILAALRKPLAGKWQALAQSPELAQSIRHLLQDPATSISGLGLVAAARRTDSLGRVADVARDVRRPVPVRLAAVNTLGDLSSSEASKVLEDLMSSHDTPLALQQVALASLATRHDGALWLLQAEKDHRVASLLKPDLATLLRNSAYWDVRRRAEARFPRPGKLDARTLPSPTALARRRGNTEHGRDLFFNKKEIRCASCHTVQSAGGHVGPDLSTIGTKASRDNLFESILFPSKAIADQYINWTVTTQRGLVLNGLIVEETPDHIILRDANGKDTRIAKADIDTRTKSQNSLMPNDLLSYMSEDDLVDVVEFLFSLKSPK